MPQVHTNGFTGKYYKFLNPGGKPANGGRGTWDLPTKREDASGGAPTWTAGKYRKVKGQLRPCSWGLHAATSNSIVKWMAPELFEMEYADGTDLVLHAQVGVSEKVVGRKSRLVKKVEHWSLQNAALACMTATLSGSWGGRIGTEVKDRLTAALAVGYAFSFGGSSRPGPKALKAAMGDAYAVAREAQLGYGGYSDTTRIAQYVGDALHSLAYEKDSAAIAKNVVAYVVGVRGEVAVNSILASFISNGPATATTTTTTTTTTGTPSGNAVTQRAG